ncbi:MAG: Eco57I restriction-modification methylase domain-containing protein, partial [Dolichospermum sp.]
TSTVNGSDFSATKELLQESLDSLNEELNEYLAREYGIDVQKKQELENWKLSHRPFHWFVEFYGIISRGGFDVIIGNPPYVEYSKVKKDYEIKGYQTEKCGNLYGFVIERIIHLQNINQRYGLIIPLSSISTDRMSILQEILMKNTELSWFSSYAERPSKLFEGVEVTLSIVLSKISTINHFIYTSGYYKWQSDYRNNLFFLIDYCSSKEFYKKGSMLKAGSNIEMSIISKLKQKEESISKLYNKKGKYNVYYRNAGGRYYKVILNFEPEFILNGEITKSSTYCNLSFESETNKDLIFLIMNSTLFYWYWVIYSDNWHMINRDISSFPIGHFSNDIKVKILQLCNKLKQSQLDHSTKKVEKRNKGKDTIQFLQFNMRNCKFIIDEIDKILAEHYGFTEEELDFIINYDRFG